MRLVAGRDLQDGGVDLDEIARREPGADVGGDELLQGEFGRGVQVARRPGPVRADQLCQKTMEVGFVAGRDLEDGGLGLGEAPPREPRAERRHDAVAGEQ